MSAPVPVPHRVSLPTKMFERVPVSTNTILDHPLYEEAIAACGPEYDSYPGHPDVQRDILETAIQAIEFQYADEKFLKKVLAAQKRIGAYTVESTLFGYDGLLGKDESQQPTESFKLRGAANFLLKKFKQAQAAGVVTASAGNHGQGVAYMANKIGVPATIVVPLHAPQVKVDGIVSWNARVLRHGNTYEESAAYAKQIQEEKHGLYVPAFEHSLVQAGQGTIGLELARQAPDANDVIVAGGGLGLAAGVSRVLRVLQPNTRVWIAGIEGHSAALLSFAQKKVAKVNQVEVLADGVATESVGETSFAHAFRCAAGALAVSRAQLVEEMQNLDKAGHRAEGAGALAFAAAKAHRHRLGEKVVCIMSGSNVDKSTLDSLTT